ncbi:MAG: hypothetical protein HY644_05130 [Acidobacteria bacterium]|nr:hypothetical protein [Acidobacteriota bacterium]
MAAARIIVAMIFGTFSGFLVYIIAALLRLVLNPSETAVPPLFFFAAFLGGWALSSFILLRKSRTLSVVFSRGFLMGATEWLFMIVMGFLYAGKAAASIISDPTAAVGFLVGSGLIALVTGGFSLFMAMLCLIGFGISYLISRETPLEPIEFRKSQWQEFAASYQKLGQEERKTAWEQLTNEQKHYLQEILKNGGIGS